MINYRDILEMVITISVSVVLVLVLIIAVYHHLLISLRNQNTELSKSTNNLKRIQETEIEKNRLITQVNSRKLNYMNSIVLTVRDGMALFDTDKKLVLMNPQAQKAFNVKNDIFFNTNYSNSNSLYRRVLKLCDVVYESGDALSEILEFKDQFFEVYVARILDKYESNKPLGVLVLLSDVTQQFKLEKLRREFVQNVSHEFRTPLTIIAGNIDTLYLWDDLDVGYRHRSLEIMQFEIERLKAILEQLLQLTKMDSNLELSEESVKLAELINEILPSYFELSKLRGIAIKFIKPSIDFDKAVYANKALLRQAFSNLIENAIKYTRENDTVYITINEDTKRNKVIVEVEDHGPGIKEEDYLKIFDRFYRIDSHRNSQTGGSGLGLSISKTLIERSKGAISVQSIEDEKTIFIVELPISQKEK